MKVSPTIAVFGINIVATIFSFFNPTLAVKLPDIYLASVGGLWMNHQMKEGNDDGNL
jgi:hypothetical protein